MSDDNDESRFSTIPITSWADFAAALASHDARWIYRGQSSSNWALQTSFERTLNSWEIDLAGAPSIEHQLIRDFRRQYRGEHHLLVNSDRLLCLALMQHHGTPTRLLDFSYSPYVAAKFAIDQASKYGAIWCLNGRWCVEAVRGIVDEGMARGRDTDASRTDSTFGPMYLNLETRKKFVYPENPFHLNERLIDQRGLFLCPGDVSVPFVQNLTALNGCHLPENIVKLCFNLDKTAVRDFASNLRRMNVGSVLPRSFQVSMVSRALLLNDSFCTRSLPREKPERPITSGLSGSTSSDAERIRRKSEGSSRDRRRNLGPNASLRRLLGCRLDRAGNQIHQPAERATSAQIDAPVLDLVRYDNSTDVEAFVS